MVLDHLSQAGSATLLALTGPRRDLTTRLADIRNFFEARIPSLVDPSALPPVIDIVSDVEDHLPLEILPIIGSADTSDSPDPFALRDIAGTLPGFAAVIRRLPDEPEPGGDVETERSRGLSVQLFRHNSLAGVHREIRALQKLEQERRLSLDLVFPPRGHRQRKFWPVKEVAEILMHARSGSNAGASENKRTRVCHFACHLYSDDDGPLLEMKPDGRWRPKPVRYHLTDLQGARDQLSGDGVAVIFLSTCRSGVTDQHRRASAVDAFRFFNAKSLIGTMADVPDLAGAEFSAEFYREASDGSAVGVALRVARLRLLLDGLHNPFGLLYTSYGGEDVSVRLSADQLGRFIPPEAETIVTGSAA